MDNAARPRIVGFLQTVLLVLGLVNGFSLLVGLFRVFNAPQSITSVPTLLIPLVSVILFFAAVNGMASRKNSGRWLAVASFTLLAARGILGIVVYASIAADPNHTWIMLIIVGI